MRNLYCIVSAFVASLGSDAELIFALKVAPRVLVMCSYFCVSDEFFFFSYLLSFCSFQPYAFFLKKSLSFTNVSNVGQGDVAVVLFFTFFFLPTLWRQDSCRILFILFERKKKQKECM